MLTRSQKKIYEFICQFMQVHSYAPTIAEIAQGLGLRARSAIHRNLQGLKEAGVLRLVSGKRRNIELVEQRQGCLPLLGRIAAGEPIEAISQEQWLNIAERFLGRNRFLLQVKGESMIEDNICDGDIIVCAKSNTAQNGQIVVALIDNNYATLKRFFWRENKVILEPANRRMAVQIYEPHLVTIQGIYVGLLRWSDVYGFGT